MTHISDGYLADSVFSAGVVDRLSIVSRHAPDERREYQSYTHLCYTCNLDQFSPVFRDREGIFKVHVPAYVVVRGFSHDVIIFHKMWCRIFVAVFYAVQ